ncbi:MAG: hypothetical protein IKR25_05515, partial [Muribaculaceae bacterium]|nr:hypothetical protein [Muribaculaceae bacterium]
RHVEPLRLPTGLGHQPHQGAALQDSAKNVEPHHDAAPPMQCPRSRCESPNTAIRPAPLASAISRTRVRLYRTRRKK